MMEKTGSKIHKLESTADRIAAKESSSDSSPEQRYVAPPSDKAMHYVAVPQYDPAFHDDAIDLLELWSIVCKYRTALLGVILLAVALSAGIATFSPSVYRAELIAASATEEKGSSLSSLAGQFGGLASLAGVSLPSVGSDVDRVMAILQSRAFLVPFLKEEPVFNAMSTRLSDENLSVLDAYNYFIDNVFDAHKDNKSGLVSLSIEWHDPLVAASWANSLILRLNEHQRKNAIVVAEQSIEYLNSQLEQTGVDNMQQAIYRLIESQTKIIMLANVKKEFAMQIIDPAVVPEKPISPRVTLIMTLGLILGVMLGVLLIFILHAMASFKLRAKQTAE